MRMFGIIVVRVLSVFFCLLVFVYTQVQFNDSYEFVAWRECAMGTTYMKHPHGQKVSASAGRIYKHSHNDLQECSRYLACHAYFMRPRRTACATNNISRNMITQGDGGDRIFLTLRTPHCAKRWKRCSSSLSEDPRYSSSRHRDCKKETPRHSPA